MCPQFSGGRFCQVVAGTGSTVLYSLFYVAQCLYQLNNKLLLSSQCLLISSVHAEAKTNFNVVFLFVQITHFSTNTGRTKTISTTFRLEASSGREKGLIIQCHTANSENVCSNVDKRSTRMVAWFGLSIPINSCVSFFPSTHPSTYFSLSRARMRSLLSGRLSQN